jgi:hypothetical protein
MTDNLTPVRPDSLRIPHRIAGTGVYGTCPRTDPSTVASGRRNGSSMTYRA